MKNLLVRTVSGIIYVALLLGCFFLGEVPFLILILVMALLAYLESTRMVYGTVFGGGMLTGFIDILCLVSVILVFAGLNPFVAVIALCLRTVAELYVDLPEPGRRIAVSFFRIIYLGIGLGTMFALSEINRTVLAVLFFIWINDTGAYAVGCLCGKHKLFERISPKKTWEGFAGGFCFCVVAAFIFAFTCNSWFGIFPSEYRLWAWPLLAVITVIFATWGDLAESLIKRNLNIKDSGNIIPGHGGILDRIDSLLLAMPAVWCLLSLLDEILL